MPWAEEVLVGRGDIDEKKQRMAELEAQVGPHLCGALGYGWAAGQLERRRECQQ